MPPDLRGLLALLVAAGIAPEAATEPLRLDPERSLADFDVGVLLFFRGRGNFGNISGEISIDAEAQATVRATIPINSLDMRRADQERWAKGPDFFDVARWPEIQFHSDPVPLETLRHGGALPGHLTIRGVERKSRFDIAPSDCDAPGRDCPVRASGWVRRSDFDLGEGRRTLADRVRLRFEIMLEQDPKG